MIVREYAVRGATAFAAFAGLKKADADVKAYGVGCQARCPGELGYQHDLPH
jgi:hypothetical protein